MVNVNPSTPLSDTAHGRVSLAQWIHQVTGLTTVRVQARLRGNHLHILYEGAACPDRTAVLPRLLTALADQPLQSRLPQEQAPIYQVAVYGRSIGQSQPGWREVIHLNQLPQYLEQWVAPVTGNRQPQVTRSHSLIVSNLSLARRGQPEGIARYLSEALASLGLAINIEVKLQPAQPTHPSRKRLLVKCESAYSPDSSLLAEPISQRLRELRLTGFGDAMVFGQVTEEPQPDWVLRVDLTPPDEMLKGWARWGDSAAIARLLNQTLATLGVQGSVLLKDATLHLSCTRAEPSEGVPEQSSTIAAVSDLLDTIAPQGIQAAAVYGFEDANHLEATDTSPPTPAWVDWLTLPAAAHAALAVPTLELARQGDESALAFLLTRLLNPSLEWQLATGGLRIQLRRRDDLLHIMTDGPTCPDQKAVGSAIGRFLQPLQIPNLAGIRVYGRRAGQKRPSWSYGIDLTPRHRLVPEATPEFAASDAYVGDLLSREIGGALVLWSGAEQSRSPGLLQRLGRGIQQVLVQSQLFSLADEPAPRLSQVAYTAPSQNGRVALVWGVLGLLITLQTDWMTGQILRPPTPPQPTPSHSPVAASPAPAKDQSVLPQLSLQKSKNQAGGVFNATDFTQKGAGQPLQPGTPLAAEPLQPKAIITATQSPYPTFNSRQLDEKVALYQQYVALNGVPDVLIIGSSRALRGVDPAALEKALASQGKPDVRVFNFGVNGATAQVVDLVIRHILKPNQLPRLVLWADGARAFNSGRVDITYNAIAISPGYRKLASTNQNQPNPAKLPAAGPTQSTSSTDVAATTQPTSPIQGPYQRLNEWLGQSLAVVSTAYPQREQLKGLLREQFQTLLTPKPVEPTLTAAQLAQGTQPSLPLEGSGLIDRNGFLPIANRFNPVTYYQEYARVSGDYDSDYEAFQLEGRQSDALRSLVEFTQSHQVSLVFVNLPLTDTYLDPVRMDYEQKFQRSLLELSTQLGFTYRDLSLGWLHQLDYFSDPSHLNRYGAYAVSRRLAQDPLIPWPMGR